MYYVPISTEKNSQREKQVSNFSNSRVIVANCR